MKNIIIATRSNADGWQGIMVDGATIGYARERGGVWCAMAEISPGIMGYGCTPEAAIEDAIDAQRRAASNMLLHVNLFANQVGL